MATISFKQARDPQTKAVSETMILYTDENGALWTVPQGHRFWDLYEQWTAEGNTIAPADPA